MEPLLLPALVTALIASAAVVGVSWFAFAGLSWVGTVLFAALIRRALGSWPAAAWPRSGSVSPGRPLRHRITEQGMSQLRAGSHSGWSNLLPSLRRDALVRGYLKASMWIVAFASLAWIILR